MSLYRILLELHSGWRFVVFILLVSAFLVALKGAIFKSAYPEGTRKLNLFAMTSAHLQFLFGLALYFTSPLVQFDKAGMKDKLIRYWTTEHIVIMILAITVITIGYSRSKKMTVSGAKHRSIAIFYGIGIFLIVLAIIMSQRPFFGMSH